MHSMEMFGLTEEQLHILYSLEYAISKKDMADDKKPVADKALWLEKWEAALNDSQEDKVSIPYKGLDQLAAAVKLEAEKSPNKTWFYLTMLEATLFVPYSPLGLQEDKRFKKLHFSNQSEFLKFFASLTTIMDPVYIDRFQKTYSKTLDKLTGKWQKVAIGALSVVAIAAIAAATAGAAAGPIAVAMFGSEFAGLSGAALTSACLAMVGGGAIAAGGFGMAGGVIAIVGGGAILGAAGGGAAVSAASLMMKSAPSFTLTQAAKLEVVLKEITLNAQKDIQNAQSVMNALRDQIKALQKELAELKSEQEEDKKTLANLEKSLKYLKKAYEDMTVFKSSFELGMEVEETEA